MQVKNVGIGACVGILKGDFDGDVVVGRTVVGAEVIWLVVSGYKTYIKVAASTILLNKYVQYDAMHIKGANHNLQCCKLTSMMGSISFPDPSSLPSPLLCPQLPFQNTTGKLSLPPNP